MPDHECYQTDRLAKMEITIEGTQKQLADNNIILTRIETLLKERILKYDEHITSGERFRAQMANTTLGIIVSLVVSIICAGVAYGSLMERVRVNTDKWTHLESKK